MLTLTELQTGHNNLKEKNFRMHREQTVWNTKKKRSNNLVSCLEKWCQLKHQMDINWTVKVIQYVQLCEHWVIMVMLRNSKQIGHRRRLSMLWYTQKIYKIWCQTNLHIPPDYWTFMTLSFVTCSQWCTKTCNAIYLVKFQGSSWHETRT